MTKIGEMKNPKLTEAIELMMLVGVDGSFYLRFMSVMHELEKKVEDPNNIKAHHLLECFLTVGDILKRIKG